MEDVDKEGTRRGWNQCDNTKTINDLSEDLISFGYFPKTWRTADVFTILKGKDKERDNPKSYRPVSLLPVLGKALEHIICERINDEIRMNMNDSKHGFIAEMKNIP